MLKILVIHQDDTFEWLSLTVHDVNMPVGKFLKLHKVKTVITNPQLYHIELLQEIDKLKKKFYINEKEKRLAALVKMIVR